MLAASFAPAADLRTLKGDAYNGTLVSVNDKEVVFTKAGGADRVTVPVDQILNLELGAQVKIPDSTWIDVELIDGSILHCSNVGFKGTNLVATLLLTGQQVVLPRAAVSSVLTGAQNEKYRRDWTDRVKKKGKKDVVAKLNEGVVNPVSGLLGEGTEDGKKINFTAKVGTEEVTVAVSLETIHGIIFSHEIDANIKPATFKLLDTYHDVVMVLSVALTAEGLTVTTPAGAKLVYPLANVAMLDYSNGKLVYLSDLRPDRLTEVSTEDRIDHYKRDRNMDGKDPIKMKNAIYSKGLALHADSRLDFDLNGEYVVFKFVAGFDDVTGGVPGPVKLRVEGDGKELYSRTFDRKTWNASTPADVQALNIKDVQTLRIEVVSLDAIGLTLGKHLVLADAKVSK
jgi:hypothetical protein